MGQGRCEQRSENFVKIIIFYFFLGGGSGPGGGVRMDVNKELMIFVKIHKKKKKN